MSDPQLWRPFDRENIRNPYPMYERLRQHDPVHRAQTEEWIITRYEDVRSILRDPKFIVGNRLNWLKKGISYFHGKTLDFASIQEVMDGFILFLNPPDHTRIRKFVSQVWNNREVSAIIQTNIRQLLQQTDDNSFDLIRDFSRPLPAMTISKILGLPNGDHTILKDLGTQMIKSLDLYITLRDLRKINEAASEFLIYFKDIIKEKRRKEDDGLISKLLRTNDQQGPLTESELLSTCILLFIAGEETSLGLTGTGIMNLIGHAAASEKLRQDPTLTSYAVEELIRYDAPVQIVGRIAGVSTIIDGKEINEGDTLTLCIGSANRDKHIFEQPDELKIHRMPNKHLGFGAGAHFCLGDWLARVQTQLAIDAVLKTFSTLEITDTELKWNENLSIRSLDTLPLKVTRL